MVQVEILEKANQANVNKFLTQLQEEGNRVADVQLNNDDVMVTYVAKLDDTDPEPVLVEDK